MTLLIIWLQLYELVILCIIEAVYDSVLLYYRGDWVDTDVRI